jgi:hypothetical protein
VTPPDDFTMGRPNPVRRALRVSLAGLLFIVFCWAGLWAGVRWGMDRLTLSPDPLRLTIVQRGSQEIPGLLGTRVLIDDITGGQVVVTLHDARDQPIVTPRSMRPGEVLPFNVNGQTFYLRVASLLNKLIGEDFGAVEISSTAPSIDGVEAAAAGGAGLGAPTIGGGAAPAAGP